MVLIFSLKVPICYSSLWLAGGFWSDSSVSQIVLLKAGKTAPSVGADVCFLFSFFFLSKRSWRSGPDAVDLRNRLATDLFSHVQKKKKKTEPAGARKKKWKVIGASSLQNVIFKQKKKKLKINYCSRLNSASIIPVHNEERISRVIEEMDFGIDVAQQPANLSL